MFHHFHDRQKHIVEQGSISSEDFSKLIDFYLTDHNIISAGEFLYKLQNNSLSCNDVCISFDDALLCQYDIALPVLEQRNIKAFWFVYTSPFEGTPEKLEIYRHFRFSKFDDIEKFYSAFFRTASSLYNFVKDELEAFNPDEYAKDFPFYTPDDKRFRYLRDKVLGEAKYNSIMDSMINEYNYNVRENINLLWMKSEHLRELHRLGHIIGLHSHTHPTLMAEKNYEGQLYEYGTNKKIIESITGSEVISGSYPCNSYNQDTLKIMRSLGIQIGFRANMGNFTEQDHELEIPREDHANIIREMRSI